MKSKIIGMSQNLCSVLNSNDVKKYKSFMLKVENGLVLLMKQATTPKQITLTIEIAGENSLKWENLMKGASGNAQKVNKLIDTLNKSEKLSNILKLWASLGINAAKSDIGLLVAGVKDMKASKPVKGNIKATAYAYLIKGILGDREKFLHYSESNKQKLTVLMKNVSGNQERVSELLRPMDLDLWKILVGEANTAADLATLIKGLLTDEELQVLVDHASTKRNKDNKKMRKALLDEAETQAAQSGQLIYTRKLATLKNMLGIE